MRHGRGFDCYKGVHEALGRAGRRRWAGISDGCTPKAQETGAVDLERERSWDRAGPVALLHRSFAPNVAMPSIATYLRLRPTSKVQGRERKRRGRSR